MSLGRRRPGALRQAQTLSVGSGPCQPLRLPSLDNTTTMNNSEGRMEKQNGYVSREWEAEGVLLAAWCRPPGARVAESRHGQTAWGRRAAQEWVCAPQWALGRGSSGHTGFFHEP